MIVYQSSPTTTINNEKINVLDENNEKIDFSELEKGLNTIINEYGGIKKKNKFSEYMKRK